MADSPVMTIDKWETNAHLIADCARLGYLRPEWRTLDPTWGHGTFWNLWQPDVLVASDLDPSKSPGGVSVDATALPHDDRSFDAVVIDGPYKLNGTPTETVDKRYGVHESTRWQNRMELLRRMLTEGARVLGDGYLLFKCQDQVCSGKVRWQTVDFTAHAETVGLGLVDRLDFLSYRPQPNGVRQVTARRNASSMLVFQRGWVWRDTSSSIAAPATDARDAHEPRLQPGSTTLAHNPGPPGPPWPDRGCVTDAGATLGPCSVPDRPFRAGRTGQGAPADAQHNNNPTTLAHDPGPTLAR